MRSEQYGDKRYTNLHYGSEIEMNLPALAAGTYYLVVYNEKERASFQFEIQR
ncbi:MAG: hypothetical protein IPI66_00995 [Chitinophagaceae bacterium]|nr:hypothetical protein [Chitinophagaceae bacterium]